jgi:hypothetical protein
LSVRSLKFTMRPPHRASRRSFGFLGIGADTRASVGEAALAQSCLQQLARLYGPDALNPRATIFKDWAADPFTASGGDRMSSGHPRPSTAPWVQGVWQERLALAGSETSATEPGSWRERSAPRRAPSTRYFNDCDNRAKGTTRRPPSSMRILPAPLLPSRTGSRRGTVPGSAFQLDSAIGIRRVQRIADRPYPSGQTNPTRGCAACLAGRDNPAEKTSVGRGCSHGSRRRNRWRRNGSPT